MPGSIDQGLQNFVSGIRSACGLYDLSDCGSHCGGSFVGKCDSAELSSAVILGLDSSWRLSGVSRHSTVIPLRLVLLQRFNVGEE